MNQYLLALLQALKSEFFISIRSFSSKLILLAPALLVLLRYSLVKISESGEQIRDSISGSPSFEDAIAINAWGYFVDGLGTGITMLGLVLIAMAAYSFSYERDTGSLRHLLIRRFSRMQLIIAKLLHLHLLAALSILLLLATAYFASGLFWEFAAVSEDGFELISEQEIREEIALGLSLALVPIPAAIAFGLFISVASHSATQAVSTSLGISIAIDVFKSMLGDYALYIYASYLPSLLDQSYLQDVSRLVRGYSDVLIDERAQQLNMLVPLPSLLLFLAAALLLVRKRNL
jgi:ABC-type transport system involved in multi-copper enzyme maturation permease subunit